jgi:hypothetical protein
MNISRLAQKPGRTTQTYIYHICTAYKASRFLINAVMIWYRKFYFEKVRIEIVDSAISLPVGLSDASPTQI